MCERDGLTASTLSFWKWRLKKEQSVGASEPARTKLARSSTLRFVELTTSPASTTAQDSRLELVVGTCIVRIPAGFDDVTLGRLLVVIREQR